MSRLYTGFLGGIMSEEDITYNKGDVLRPECTHTGYCQIFHVENVPESRKRYYMDDKLYHVYTDFGNKVVYTKEELEMAYTVVGNEPVHERMLKWKENVLSMVEEYESMLFLKKRGILD